MFIVLEWSSVILGMIGTVFASSGKHNIKYTWPLWIVANILILFVFLNMSQYGLFTMTLVSLVFNIYGAYNCYYVKDIFKQDNTHQKFMEYLSKILAVVGCSIIIYMMLKIVLNIHNSDFKTYIIPYEWSVTFLCLAGLAALTAKSNYSKYGWVLWIIGNGMCAFLAYVNAQYGILVQQSFYVILAINGVYFWFIKSIK